jgi:hypothetical protein
MSLLLIVAIIVAGVAFWKVAWKLLVIGALVTFVWEIVLIVQDLHHIVMK